jgi:hypothetical protein
MEDILDLYARPYDPAEPVVCFDETSKQLVEQTQPVLPVQPGQPAREDYEYVRNGTANLFLLYEPRRGWRHVNVTERRTTRDFAHQLQALVDTHYPAADRLHLVLDQLNTHTPAALYATFPPEEAQRLAQRLCCHHTPTHASWLNQAEIEFAVLSRQGLDRRIPDQPTLATEVAAWEDARNAAGTASRWLFSVEDARSKLTHLYPVTSSVANH